MYIIGAALDKENAKAAVYNEAYECLAVMAEKESALASVCLAVIEKAGIKKEEVAYVGVALGADAADAAVADLEKTLGIKCYGAALMNVRALGEAYLAKDVSSLFMLKIDDTMDCGIVIDKKIYAGAHSLGGKVAHMVVDFGGFECTCGRLGCFEAYASNAGLRRIAAEAGVAGAEAISHKALFAMDTPEAEKAKKLYVKYLASGITNIVNLFQPNELVLEGPFTEVADALMKPMMDIVLREQYTRNAEDKCDVRFANTAADTALLGAALLGR